MPSFDARAQLRSLEATNRALSTAISARTAFQNTTQFLDRATHVSRTLRLTEPRSERDATLVSELEALELPSALYLPLREGEYARRSNLPPRHAPLSR